MKAKITTLSKQLQNHRKRPNRYVSLLWIFSGWRY